MRKNSSDKSSVLSSAYFPIFQSNSSVYKTIPTNASFHTPVKREYIPKDQDSFVNLRVKRNSRILRDDTAKPVLNQEIKRAKEELQAIKRQLRLQRSFTQAANERKIGKLVSLIKDSTSQRFPTSPQQIYYPVPMPMPVPYPVPPSHPSESHRSRITKYDSAYDTSNAIRNRFKDKEFKSKRTRKNMRRWRKVGNAILFILYLKRFCREFQSGRKVMFSKFLKKYKQISAVVVKSLRASMQPLFKLLKVNEEVKFQIEAGERRQIQREKVTSLKNVVRLILQSLLGLVQSNQGEIVEFCYFFCRHGSFVCTEPLLTEQELELVCISAAFKYISAEKNLEKASIISLLFIDTLIANTFLSPHSLSQSTAIENNLFFLSSVLYQLAIHVQDEYLLKVPKSYRIGNYAEFESVQFRESIVLSGEQRRPGELISGMKSEEQMKRCIDLKEWSQQRKGMTTVVNAVWQAMKALHKKLASKYF